MKIGCHISIAGGIEHVFSRAAQLGCEAIQVFTQNQRQWKQVEVEEEQCAVFREQQRTFYPQSVPIVSHNSYLINLCAQDAELLAKSQHALIMELKRCAQLGITDLVIHPGSHGGKGEEWGCAQIADSLNLVLAKSSAQVRILLETTAGQGNSIGHTPRHFRQIIDRLAEPHRVGICVDTCHVFAAGFDLRSAKGREDMLKSFEDILAPTKILAWHFNDSKTELGSHRDRHAAIGEGHIGKEAFRYFMNHPAYMESPAILEVPGGNEVFSKNLDLLRGMRLKD